MRNHYKDLLLIKWAIKKNAAYTTNQKSLLYFFSSLIMRYLLVVVFWLDLMWFNPYQN